MRRVLRHVQNCDTDQQGKNFHMYSINQSLDDKYYINQMGCIELLTSFSSAVRRSSTSCCFLFSSEPFLFIFSLHCRKLCRGIKKQKKRSRSIPQEPSEEHRKIIPHETSEEDCKIIPSETSEEDWKIIPWETWATPDDTLMKTETHLVQEDTVIIIIISQNNNIFSTIACWRDEYKT